MPRLKYSLIPVVALTLALTLGTARGEAPLTALNVYPADINLETSRDRQSFVVQATFADGLTRDVTAEAKTTFAHPNMVKLEGNVVKPLTDGTTDMRIEWGGKTLVVPVKVKDAKIERPISFKLDVMPVFMRAGCNAAPATAPPEVKTASACRYSASIPMEITFG